MARDMASRQLVLEEISAAARKRLEARQACGQPPTKGREIFED